MTHSIYTDQPGSTTHSPFGHLTSRQETGRITSHSRSFRPITEDTFSIKSVFLDDPLIGGKCYFDPETFTPNYSAVHPDIEKIRSSFKKLDETGIKFCPEYVRVVCELAELCWHATEVVPQIRFDNDGDLELFFTKNNCEFTLIAEDKQTFNYFAVSPKGDYLEDGLKTNSQVISDTITSVIG